MKDNYTNDIVIFLLQIMLIYSIIYFVLEYFQIFIIF